MTIDKVLPFASDREVRVQVVVASDEPGPVALTGRIVPADGGEPLWEGPIATLGPDQARSKPIERTLSNLKPRLWSPATPVLYNLVVEARRGDATLATRTVRFGFRSFTSEAGRFLLNGKPIFLRGLAINPPGRDIPDEVGYDPGFARAYVKYLRSQNVNAIRMSFRFGDAHEPRQQVWFDACDELGMMVYQGNYGGPPSPKKPTAGRSYDPEEQRDAFAGHDPKAATNSKSAPPTDFDGSIELYKQGFETYARHPSIVIYTLTNEVPGPLLSKPPWHEYLTKASQRIRAWDPTRQIIANAGYGLGREGDINDVHRYWGWYYNSFLTYYQLRDSVELFGDWTEQQPLTFSECVGAFTSPLGAFNAIFAKQLAPQLGWTGHAKDQPAAALAYQSFLVERACESFRTMRSQNHRLAGIMPFTIQFFHYRDIDSFEQMKPKPSMEQMGISYQPVLLSWELWTPQVYAGTTLRAIAHVVNDAEDFSDLPAAKLAIELKSASNDKVVARQTIDLPRVPYFAAKANPVAIELPKVPTGDYVLGGTITRDGKLISKNDTSVYIVGERVTAPASDASIAVYDPRGATTQALTSLGFRVEPVKDLSVRPKARWLVIGQEAFDAATPLPALKEFVAAGGRVLCLGQRKEAFDTDWLPARIEMLESGALDPTYPNKIRPTAEQTHVNPQRPWHPVLAGVGRERLAIWSDYSGWDQSKLGFPKVFPVTYGFRTAGLDDLHETAVIASYDRGLDAIAIAEMFDGDGSVVLTSLDLIPRVGLDPVADQVLTNLVNYLFANDHERLPLVEEPIVWGDYPTERGVLAGMHNGLMYNCRWVPPPTMAPGGKPMADNTGEWASNPGNPFLPIGVRPYGPYYWAPGASSRQGSEDPIGEGFFRCRVPADRAAVVNVVENREATPLEFGVGVNGPAEVLETIPPGKTVEVVTPIPEGETDLTIRFRGHKEMVVLKTMFR